MKKGEDQSGIQFNTGQRLVFQTKNDAALPTHPAAEIWGLMSWRESEPGDMMERNTERNCIVCLLNAYKGGSQHPNEKIKALDKQEYGGWRREREEEM